MGSEGMGPCSARPVRPHAFLGDDNRVGSRLLVSDTPSCSRGSDRPPSPRQPIEPIHLVAWRDETVLDLDRDGGDRMNRRGAVADTVAFCGGGCRCPTRRVYSSCAAPVPFLCSGLHMRLFWVGLSKARCVQNPPRIGKVDRNRLGVGDGRRAHARRDAQLYLVQSPAPRPAVAASGCLFGTCKAATLPKSETGLPSFSRNRPGGCTDVS